MIGAELGALVVAFVLTVVELTEIVALVFALGAGAATIRHGAMGAVAGVAVVALLALGTGAAILAVSHGILLWASAVVLVAFGVVLFRSTLRTYRRAAAARRGAPPPPPRPTLQFVGGFTVGAVEATEVVVVLLALTAAGEGRSAILGAVAAGVVLVVAAALVHERIRRIKTAWLKLGATSMIWTFAVFWAGEAAGLRWPYGDLVLLTLFAASLVVVRGAIAAGLRRGHGVGANPPPGGDRPAA